MAEGWWGRSGSEWTPGWGPVAVSSGIMNRREKRTGRWSRKQREAALREVEDHQFTLRQFVDRALFVWMPVVISIVAVVVVIIWQTQ
jgi:hypothetical protein